MAIDVNTVLQRTPGDSQHARVIDFGWMLCRQPFEDTLFTLVEDQRHVIPAWTSFNILLQMNEVPHKSCIGYCPVIEASPTELPTVYTLLKRSLQMGDQLNQSDVMVVLDQAIYAKALEVIWQNQEQFRRMVVRMGSFHVMCAFMAAIGKRFGDAGLADILIESGVVGTGSVAGVLEESITTELFVCIRYKTENFEGGKRGLVVGRQTCDLAVLGSNPSSYH